MPPAQEQAEQVDAVVVSVSPRRRLFTSSSASLPWRPGSRVSALPVDKHGVELAYN